MWFGKLRKLANKVKGLDSDKVSVDVFGKHEIQRYIIDLNRIEQLLKKGEDSKGDVIGTYSEFTDIFTQGETFTFEGYITTKRAGSHYTLLDTGDFYKSFRIVQDKDGFKIWADDEKEDAYLTEKYGKNILGLSTENKHELVEKMLPLFIQLVRKRLLS